MKLTNKKVTYSSYPVQKRRKRFESAVYVSIVYTSKRTIYVSKRTIYVFSGVPALFKQSLTLGKVLKYEFSYL